jgi:hypothetical protein
MAAGRVGAAAILLLQAAPASMTFMPVSCPGPAGEEAVPAAKPRLWHSRLRAGNGRSIKAAN